MQNSSKRPHNIQLIHAVIASLAIIVASGHEMANAEPIPLYDNMPWERDPDPDAGRWHGWPENSSEWAAQSFLTGDSDNVSSVTVDFRRRGQPTGELSVEIWDDNGAGVPGKLVGVVGAIDIASLAEEWEFITLDSPVTGLAPHSSYYVVLNPSNAIISGSNSYVNGVTISDEGTHDADLMLLKLPSRWTHLKNVTNANFSYMQAAVTAEATTTSLRAGDADRDFDFDQLDLVQVQVAAKYLTGQAATWGEGDWDGAPGGSPGSPPSGDKLFNQFDIIAAQRAATYLTGPYAAIQLEGQSRDGPTSVVYDPSTGDSTANLGGSFDNDTDGNIFKATFGSSFGSVSFGNVALAGLSEEFLLGDLTVVGSMAGGGDLGNVDLVYVPEPTSSVLLVVGLLIGFLHFYRANRGYAWCTSSETKGIARCLTGQPLRGQRPKCRSNGNDPIFDSRRKWSENSMTTKRCTKTPPAAICSASMVAILMAAVALAFACEHATADAQTVSLYDHLDPGRDPDPDAGRWRAWIESTTEWTAQSFLTGDLDNVSSVAIDFLRIGRPRGEYGVEIWDDDGRKRPGNLVETLGSVDVESLSDEWELVTFDRQVTGLIPDSTYFVVLNPSNLTNVNQQNSVANGFSGSNEGTNGARIALGRDTDTTRWATMTSFFNPNFAYLDMAVMAEATTALLLAGDADQDLDFDQLDLVQVQVAAKYLTGQVATWGEGDWNGAPGGSPGNPPTGDGLFNQFDIIAAQQGAAYLTGPYAAVRTGGETGDGQTSIVYDPGTGELAIDAPAGTELTSINIDSRTGIFTGDTAANLGGSFDNDADGNIFKATFGSSFGSVSFGNVALAGLSEEFLLNDLSVVGSLAGGGDLGNVDLVYVPEPASALLFVLGLSIGLLRFRRIDR